MKEDRRPAFVAEDVKGLRLVNVKAPVAEGVKRFVLMNVEGFSVAASEGIADTRVEKSEKKEF